MSATLVHFHFYHKVFKHAAQVAAKCNLNNRQNHAGCTIKPKVSVSAAAAYGRFKQPKSETTKETIDANISHVEK